MLTLDKFEEASEKVREVTLTNRRPSRLRISSIRRAYRWSHKHSEPRHKHLHERRLSDKKCVGRHDLHTRQPLPYRSIHSIEQVFYGHFPFAPLSDQYGYITWPITGTQLPDHTVEHT